MRILMMKHFSTLYIVAIVMIVAAVAWLIAGGITEVPIYLLIVGLVLATVARIGTGFKR